MRSPRRALRTLPSPRSRPRPRRSVTRRAPARTGRWCARNLSWSRQVHVGRPGDLTTTRSLAGRRPGGARGTFLPDDAGTVDHRSVGPAEQNVVGRQELDPAPGRVRDRSTGPGGRRAASIGRALSVAPARFECRGSSRYEGRRAVRSVTDVAVGVGVQEGLPEAPPLSRHDPSTIGPVIGRLVCFFVDAAAVRDR